MKASELTEKLGFDFVDRKVVVRVNGDVLEVTGVKVVNNNIELSLIPTRDVMLDDLYRHELEYFLGDEGTRFDYMVDFLKQGGYNRFNNEEVKEIWLKKCGPEN